MNDNKSAWDTIAEAMNDDESFCGALLSIKTKKMAILPFDLNAAQRDFLAHRTGRDIILKARQHGFSTLLQARAFRLNVTETSNALTISDTDANTQKLRTIYQRFYDKWPEDVPKPDRARDSTRMVTYPLLDSEMICVTAGAKTGGRGGTVSFFHGSEVAFWPNAESVFGAALQGTTPNSEIYLESTPNGAQGTFYDLCMAALDEDPSWRLHFYPWWWADEYRVPLEPDEVITPTPEEEDAILKAHQGGFDLKPEQIKFRRQKRKELPHNFPQEYPEDPRSCFLLSGSSYFGDMTKCYGAPFGATPSDDFHYDAGLDFGQANDYTVLSIGCRETKQQVAALRVRQLPWGEMRRRIVEMCVYWKVSRLLAEINSIGGVNYEELGKEFGAALPGKSPLLAFTTTAQTKPALAQSLYDGLHRQGLQLLPIPEQKRDFAAFQAKQSPHTMNWKYEAAKGEHDDFVIAAGLMWLAMNKPAIAALGYLD